MPDAISPIQAPFAHDFAQDWIQAWNSHDLERILSHYDDDVTLASPVALRLINDGVIRGKAALRDYFSRGLQAYPDLRFDLIDTFWGIETIVLYYTSNFRSSNTAEVMLLNPAGKVIHVWANYDQ